MLQEFLGLKKFRRFFLLRLFESRKKEHAESICNPSPCAFASLWLCVKKEVYSAGSAFGMAIKGHLSIRMSNLLK